MNTRYLPFIIFLIFSLCLDAQTYVIHGRVVEKQTLTPIPFALVKAIETQENRAVSSTITSDNGSFSLECSLDSIKLVIEHIGYLKYQKIKHLKGHALVDLGIIELFTDTHNIGEYKFEGLHSRMEFQSDKRIYYYDNNISNTGGSALSLLDNIPSLSVNMQGQISLRGSTSIKILIDGKPTILSTNDGRGLANLSANLIQKIEIITNPSANFEAEGSSGIINIVLKRDEEKVQNGSVSLQLGLPNNHALGASLSKKSKKMTLNTQIGFGYRSFPEEFKTNISDLMEETILFSFGKMQKNEMFGNINLNLSYQIKPEETISFDVYLALEDETENALTNFQLQNNIGFISSWSRTEQTEGFNPKFQFQTSYKKSFSEKKKNVLLISATTSIFNKAQKSFFENDYTSGSQNNSQRESYDINYSQHEIIIAADYHYEVSKRTNFEAGAHTYYQNVYNQFLFESYINQQWTEVQELTNTFNYNQFVSAGYASFNFDFNKWSVKSGIRLENTQINLFLKQNQQKNYIDFFNLFPTLHISYNVSKIFSLQGGLSRRIYRPKFWHLNPFVYIRNNFDTWGGTPELLPEFTNNVEISTALNHPIISVATTLYHRHVTNTIEYVSVFNDGATHTSPQNIGQDFVAGFELNLKIMPKKWWVIQSDFDINHQIRNGSFNNQSFAFNTKQWNLRCVNKIDLPKHFSFELTAVYRSSYESFQRRHLPFAFLNFGIRKRFLNGKLALQLSIRDLFASRNFQNAFSNTRVYQEDFNFEGRFFTFNISYGIGKSKAVHFQENSPF